MLSKTFNAWRNYASTQTFKKNINDVPVALKKLITEYYKILPRQTDCTRCKKNRICFIIESEPYCKCCLYTKNYCHIHNCHYKIAFDGTALCGRHLVQMFRKMGVSEEDIQKNLKPPAGW